MNKEAFLKLENGRFAGVLQACSGFNDCCFRCRYFDKTAADSYRCYGIGSCPAATLSERTIDYLFKHTAGSNVQDQQNNNTTRSQT